MYSKYFTAGIYSHQNPVMRWVIKFINKVRETTGEIRMAMQGHSKKTERKLKAEESYCWIVKIAN